jgi:hypothetical protein
VHDDFDRAIDARLREAALNAALGALRLAGRRVSPEQITEFAAPLYAWLAGRRLAIRVSTITYGQGSPPRPQLTKYQGEAVQLTDIQQVTLSVEPEDSKGDATSDTLTWSVDDATVITLQPSADTLSCLCVAGNPGTASVTVTDGTISASDALIVTASAATQLVLTEGTLEPQAPAA